MASDPLLYVCQRFPRLCFCRRYDQITRCVFCFSSADGCVCVRKKPLLRNYVTVPNPKAIAALSVT